MRLFDLLFSKARHILPTFIGRPYDLTIIIRPIEFCVETRRVPRLMWVPRIYPEKEVLLVVAFQPLHCLGEGPRSTAVGFKAPCRTCIVAFTTPLTGYLEES
jgi:hypothetical protein